VKGKNPEQAVFSTDGRLVHVSAEEAEQVDVIDVAKRDQVATIQIGRTPVEHGDHAGRQEALRRERTFE
jgi:hypothetical protein